MRQTLSDRERAYKKRWNVGKMLDWWLVLTPLTELMCEYRCTCYNAYELQKRGWKRLVMSRGNPRVLVGSWQVADRLACSPSFYACNKKKIRQICPEMAEIFTFQIWRFKLQTLPHIIKNLFLKNIKNGKTLQIYIFLSKIRVEWGQFKL